MMTRLHVCVALVGWACVACRSSTAAPGASARDAGVAAAACPDPAAAAAPEAISLAVVSWPDLPGWGEDRQGEAIPALLASCAKLAKLGDHERVGVAPYGGKAKDWRRACATAKKLKVTDHAAARAWFEREFEPYAAAAKAGPVGKLTGYYVESMRGSKTRKGAYQVPIYGRPKDLVLVDLTHFLDDARGRRVWGRLDSRTGAVVPYPTRAEIRKGALDGERLEII